MSVDQHKCGTVALLGLPNAGKSSLLNALVGCQVAITAKMAGTTREAIRGILNTADAQIIFVDTPGMQVATNLLERKMNRAISGAVKAADVICFVLDVNNVSQDALAKLANYADFGAPVILALTKIDSVRPEKILQVLAKLKQFTFIKEFIPVSTYKKIGLKDLVQSISNYLPAGAAIYDVAEYTDATTRQMAAEIIRGAVINNIRDEVPAGVKVVVTEFTTQNRTTKIAADIICDKPNHKKIIIGAGGALIRKIGTQARQELESLLGQHVVLNTFVMVREGWRDKENWLVD